MKSFYDINFYVKCVDAVDKEDDGVHLLDLGGQFGHFGQSGQYQNFMSTSVIITI